METQLTVQNQQQGLNFFSNDQIETIQRACKMFAYSELVPDMYKVSATNPENKAIANCMIALDMSQRIGASPLMIMQNLVIIYGRPSWSSKFLISTVNTCGRFNPLQYRFFKDGKVGKLDYTDYEWVNGKKSAVKKTFDGTDIDNDTCVCYTTQKGSDEVLESSPVSIKMAIQEGWYSKAGSKWRTMPKQMLIYRTASFWTSAYAPELSMGMKTVEEVEDIEYVEVKENVFEKVAEEIKAENASIEIKMPETKEPLVPETVSKQKTKKKEPESTIEKEDNLLDFDKK